MLIDLMQTEITFHGHLDGLHIMRLFCIMHCSCAADVLSKKASHQFQLPQAMSKGTIAAL